MEYTIYHAVPMNHDCEPDKQYKKICTISAVSWQEAFKKSQNGFFDEYSKQGVRSTSVGDIMYNHTLDTYFIIKGIGIRQITKSFFSLIS